MAQSETAPDNLIEIGTVLKSNGSDGELLMGFREIDPEDIDVEEPVFIYFDGLPVPFFIKSISEKGSSKALVRLRGISSLKDAEEVTGKGVFVDGSVYSFEDAGEDFTDLVGWTVIDEKGDPLGVVSGVEDIPGNPCLYIQKENGEESLIPLHEDFIVSADYDSRTLSVSLPDGLL